MKEENPLIQKAELCARDCTKTWIQTTLRECFFQGLKMSWTLRPADGKNGQEQRGSIDHESRREGRPAASDQHGRKNATAMSTDPSGSCRVELSMSDVAACIGLVERLAKHWQEKLREERHDRVAEWIEEIYQQGRPNLWSDATSILFPSVGDAIVDKNCVDSVMGVATEIDPPGVQQVHPIGPVGRDGDGNDLREHDPSTLNNDKSTATTIRSPIVDFVAKSDVVPYCELRNLGSKQHFCTRTSALPASEAVKQLKDLITNHASYWPLDGTVIDEAAVAMALRTSARDKNGIWAGKGHASSLTALQHPSSRDRRVRFQPSSEVDPHANGSRDFLGQGRPLEKKRKHSKPEVIVGASVQTVTTFRREMKEDVPRPPWDIPERLDSATIATVPLSAKEKLELDGLVTSADAEKEDTTSNVPLVLFGGLVPVGLTNCLLQQDSENISTMDVHADDTISRRKRNAALQERIDPHRLQHRTDNPRKIKSKFLRTEDWFDSEKKFFDFDLGWSLMEVEADDHQATKRLCAFSSMEVSLEDSAAPH